MRFDEHLRIYSDKAAGVTTALARIMPNIEGPRQSRRGLLSSVTTSILLYAAPIWTEAMGTKEYGCRAISVYRRSALRVACAFRMVSYNAVCIVAGMPPIDLLAGERRRIFRRKRQKIITVPSQMKRKLRLPTFLILDTAGPVAVSLG